MDVSLHPVLGLPELRVMVLENLDMMDLLRCEQVCKTFHDTIQDTVSLQVRTFRRASQPPEYIQAMDQQHLEEPKYLSHGKIDKSGQLVAPALLHPVLESRYEECASKPRDDDSWEWSIADWLAEDGGDTIQFVHDFNPLISGSWREMQLSQPPCTEAHIAISWSIGEHSGSYSSSHIASQGESLSFEDIFKAIDQDSRSKGVQSLNGGGSDAAVIGRDIWPNAWEFRSRGMPQHYPLEQVLAITRSGKPYHRKIRVFFQITLYDLIDWRAVAYERAQAA